MREPENTHVALLMGGFSAEREVSLDTGKGCREALEQAGFNVTAIDADRSIARTLEELRPDVVFNALHGKWGEDGTIQGIFETLQIPYTHSGVLASALAMDKHRAKVQFVDAGIPVAEGKVVDLQTVLKGNVMPAPYVVKPVAEGSSVGVHIIAKGQNSMPAELQNQSPVNSGPLLVERYIPGRELTCAVMGGVALGVIEIQTAVGFYDYKAKYVAGGSMHVLPAEIPPDVYRKVQRYSLLAYSAIGCRGVARCDFRFDDTTGKDGELILLEINTQPGMTKTSLVPELAAHAGHSFSELCAWMVQDASVNR